MKFVYTVMLLSLLGVNIISTILSLFWDNLEKHGQEFELNKLAK